MVELVGGEHALVGQGARGQRGEVDVGLALGALAQAEGQALQGHAADPRARRRRRRAGTNVGITLRAVAPSVVGVDRHLAPAEDGEALLVGDLLDPLRGSSATASASPGRNAVPTAYAPRAGERRSRRRRAGTRRAPACRMPAPSPELASAPAAPRWSRLRRAVSALATMSWLASPVRVATKATPHASCSWRGS